MTYKSRDIALLVDASNMVKCRKQLELIYTSLLPCGKVGGVRRIYLDDCSRIVEISSYVRHLGFDDPIGERGVSADELLIDDVQALLSSVEHANVDAIAIASNDKHFVECAKAIKESGRRFITVVYQQAKKLRDVAGKDNVVQLNYREMTGVMM